jgi:hypothetical protein
MNQTGSEFCRLPFLFEPNAEWGIRSAIGQKGKKIPLLKSAFERISKIP